MATIAFTMIGHNEAKNLPRALESVSWADQIIYVDCESSDNSPEVARRFTEHVFARPNMANLNVNKSFAIEKATADWIFYLDPDEAVPAGLADEIRAAIGAESGCNAYRLPRRNHFFGRWLRHGGLYPDTQLRLFRRGKAAFPCRDVHESLEVEGKIGALKEPMDHFTSETVLDSLKKMEFYSSFHGERMARELPPPTALTALRYMVIKPAGRFIRRYLFKGGFMDGWPGFLQASIGSIDFQYRFIKFWHFSRDGGREKSGEEGGE